MKSYLFILISFVTLSFLSCSKKITPGKYIYEADGSYFEIDSNDNYYFTSVGGSSQVLKFSKGKVKYDRNEVVFVPDSSFFFHISVLKHYFDTTLKDNRKIILSGSDKIISQFDLSLDNSRKFIVKNYVIYKPKLPSYQDGSLTLTAELKDSITTVPRVFYKYLISNRITFSDVTDDDSVDKPWNVLELKVNLSREMFAFVPLPPYILRKSQLIKKDWPVYKLATK